MKLITIIMMSNEIFVTVSIINDYYKILSNYEIQLLLLLIMTITTNNITNIHTRLNSAKLRVVCR